MVRQRSIQIEFDLKIFKNNVKFYYITWMFLKMTENLPKKILSLTLVGACIYLQEILNKLLRIKEKLRKETNTLSTQISILKPS